MIPETLETKRAFIAVFTYVVDARFSGLADKSFAVVGYEDSESGRGNFHYDLACAVDATADVLGLPAGAEAAGTYYEWVDALGYAWDGVDEDELYDFVTLYTEPGLESGVLTFQCQAESADHAEEQCKSVYPDADVVWAYRGTSAVDAVEDYLSNGSPKQ